MPADASIYSLIQQPRAQSPIEGIGGALQLKALVGQQELQGLQLKQAQKAIDDEAATSAAYAQSGGDPVKLKELLYSKGLFKPAMAVEKNTLDTERLRAATAKDRVAALKDTIDIHRSGLNAVNDQMAYSGWRANVIKDVPQFAATLPEQFSPEVKRDLLLKGDELVKQLTPRFEKVGDQMVDVNPNTNPSIRGMTIPQTVAERETARHNQETERAAREAAARAGKHYDADRGVVVDLSSGATTPVAGATKTPKLTEAQGNATGFGMRAVKANDEIIALENAGTFGKKAAVKQGLGNVPLIGGVLEGAMNVAPSALGGMGAEDQRYEQAQRDFINAVLRKESGANINKDEFVNARKQYFPQPGDTPEVIEQKRQNRLTAIEALKVQAGQGSANIPASAVAAKSLTKKGPQVSGGIKFLGFE